MQEGMHAQALSSSTLCAVVVHERAHRIRDCCLRCPKAVLLARTQVSQVASHAAQHMAMLVFGVPHARIPWPPACSGPTRTGRSRRPWRTKAPRAPRRRMARTGAAGKGTSGPSSRGSCTPRPPRIERQTTTTLKHQCHHQQHLGSGSRRSHRGSLQPRPEGAQRPSRPAPRARVKVKSWTPRA